mgnify:CR=1 FL=1
MGDISLDAAAIKELDDPVLASQLQWAFQSIGTMVGGIVMVKLANPFNWSFLKTETAFCSP